MRLDIPQKDSHRLVILMTALLAEFPELSNEAMQIACTAEKGVTIEVRPLVYDHTSRQRGYYHLWKGKFAEWCGNTPDEMHEEILCQTYGSEICQTRLGQKIRPLMRSSQANRMEYSLLIDTLIRVAAILDFVVPPPVRRMEEEY
jgi:hypothetical protein